MFVRGRIGPLPQYWRDLDASEERAAIEENWIKTGKMLAWNMTDDSEFRIVGPSFNGSSWRNDLRFGFVAFRSLEDFLEFLDAAPEHVAIHRRLIKAKEAAGVMGPGPASSAGGGFGFLATDDKDADIQDMRNRLRKVYRKLDGPEGAWLGMPPSFKSEQLFLGDD